MLLHKVAQANHHRGGVERRAPRGRRWLTRFLMSSTLSTFIVFITERPLGERALESGMQEYADQVEL